MASNSLKLAYFSLFMHAETEVKLTHFQKRREQSLLLPQYTYNVEYTMHKYLIYNSIWDFETGAQ